jgi:hypothetical protein
MATGHESSVPSARESIEPRKDRAGTSVDPTEARNDAVGSDDKATSSIAMEANRPLKAVLGAQAA